MVFALVTKKFRAWRIARNTRGQEFKPPQFSQGHRVGKLRYYTEGDENSQITLVFVHGYTLAAQAWHVQVAAFRGRARRAGSADAPARQRLRPAARGRDHRGTPA